MLKKLWILCILGVAAVMISGCFTTDKRKQKAYMKVIGEDLKGMDEDIDMILGLDRASTLRMQD